MVCVYTENWIGAWEKEGKTKDKEAIGEHLKKISDFFYGVVLAFVIRQVAVFFLKNENLLTF